MYTAIQFCNHNNGEHFHQGLHRSKTSLGNDLGELIMAITGQRSYGTRNIRWRCFVSECVLLDTTNTGDGISPSNGAVEPWVADGSLKVTCGRGIMIRDRDKVSKLY